MTFIHYLHLISNIISNYPQSNSNNKTNRSSSTTVVQLQQQQYTYNIITYCAASSIVSLSLFRAHLDFYSIIRMHHYRTFSPKQLHVIRISPNSTLIYQRISERYSSLFGNLRILLREYSRGVVRKEIILVHQVRNTWLKGLFGSVRKYMHQNRADKKIVYIKLKQYKIVLIDKIVFIDSVNR